MRGRNRDVAKRTKTEVFPADKIGSDNMPLHAVDDTLFVFAMMTKLGCSCSVKEFGRRMNIVTHLAGNRQTKLYGRLLWAFQELGRQEKLAQDGQKWRLFGSAASDRIAS